MNPLWGLKPVCPAVGTVVFGSQKHESSLGIETIVAIMLRTSIAVPKSMNPLWGLKLGHAPHESAQRTVPKSMNPLWGLKHFV